MTDFDRVKAYYRIFPEEDRFKIMGFSGIMEYEMTMRIFAKYMGWNRTVLEQTETDDCIVETCSHAMYIGEKVGK